jgi:hypothetical protein
MTDCKSTSIDPFPNPEDQKYQEVDEDKRGNRKIKPEVWSLNSYIAGQVPQPFQVSAEEINTAYEHQVFANLAIHSINYSF